MKNGSLQICLLPEFGAPRQQSPRMMLDMLMHGMVSFTIPPDQINHRKLNHGQLSLALSLLSTKFFQDRSRS